MIRETLRHSPIKYNTENLSSEELMLLYKRMLLSRLIEERMLKLLRQGKVSKWFSGIGQEAVAVSVGSALDKNDFILPLHRNLGVFISREIPLWKLFAQWQGKKEGFTKGRDRSFHFGTLEYKIIGMISHLGSMLGVADGIALAEKLKNTGQIATVFIGDGGANEGDVHEAMNLAAVWKLPVVFMLENNGYALSTPVKEQYIGESLVKRAEGYGMKGIRIDGNNVLEVYQTLKKVSEEIRKNPEPVLIEAITFRMRGHEEASGTKYVPKDLMKDWAERDPVLNFEKFLVEKNYLSRADVEEIKKTYNELILSEWQKAFALPPVKSSEQEELQDVYAPSPKPDFPKTKKTKKLRLVDAVSEGLEQAMEQIPDLVIMGQDVAEYGGVFKVTQGFIEKFGKQRVRNTPLCEAAVIGAGLGLALRKIPNVVEMQFSDFVSEAFNQIVNNLAKTHYRWNESVNVTVRMPTGAGVSGGPFHSQSTEGWFAHVPGLKLVYPSNPYDAKGLLIASILDPNPVMFYEHKFLYRSVTGEVPEEFYSLPIGKARIEQEGNEVSVITYGLGVHYAKEIAKKFKETSIEILDLRTLLPYDKEAILKSVKKTGKVIILYEDTFTYGIGAEISAFITENAFEFLDAPVMRVASLDTPVPFAKSLEELFLPKQRFEKKLQELLEY